MEDAYNKLYEQFLHLKSLCLKQAALLHELSTALQKHQGSTVPNGELSDMMSTHVKCVQDIPAYLKEQPCLQTATVQNPAEPSGVDHLSRNMWTFSDILAEDISQLSVDGPFQKKENQGGAQNAVPSLHCDPCVSQGFSSKVSKNLWQTDHLSEDMTMQVMRMPTEGNTSLTGHFPSQSDGLLLSDVALQSHVCEFCQATFPGDTTTRGEFLRHLYTHVT
ncbi:uncharacterized protein zgc:113184 [Antennarius striatus]|uniref:uncharacterized protein zgc:113184 n=1 Tax=Antennarius striatus TaxID=241820 RepID=UPI0035B1EF76